MTHPDRASHNVAASPDLRITVSHLWTSILDLFFPPRCAVCKRRGSWFCPRCREQVSYINPPVCVHCGQELVGGTICENCLRDRRNIDGVRATAHFEGPLRQVIHALKYNGVRELASPLGELLYEGFTRYAPPADLVIPVPLHSARLNQRGFNQSVLLAHELAERAHLPVDSRGLVRVRNTPSQIGLGVSDRRRNMQDAFAWRGERLNGQRVLVVDDVCTTGATIEACAAPLYQAGALSVWGLALARERFR